jgi:hypothetical protein
LYWQCPTVFLDLLHPQNTQANVTSLILQSWTYRVKAGPATRLVADHTTASPAYVMTKRSAKWFAGNTKKRVWLIKPHPFHE